MTALVSRLYEEYGGPSSALTVGGSGAGVLYPTMSATVGVDGNERGSGYGLVRTNYLVAAASGSVVSLLADVAEWRVSFGLIVGLLGCYIVALVLN